MVRAADTLILPTLGAIWWTFAEGFQGPVLKSITIRKRLEVVDKLIQQYNHERTTPTALPMSFDDKNKDESSKTKQQEINDEGISDVDARVLREMLQESKLDLETEEGVRKLLERGVTKTVGSGEAGVGDNKQKDDNEQSGFQSELFQKLADTRLWRSFSAKTNDILESAKLWVGNKIEQDVKALAALGIFAWDRVVKDVSRALPAAGSTARKTIFLLTNSSSYEEPPPATSQSLRDELNKPADEIRAVSQAIWDILNGNSDTPGEGGRGLRTVASAGTANMAERQRRAYQQTRRKRQEESGVKGISKIPGGIVDATYELKQELKAESNPAGYKTKPIREAIEAGVVGTGKYLQGIQESARLAAAERKAKRLQASTESKPESKPASSEQAPASFFATPVETNVQPSASLFDFEEVLLDLQIERDAVLNRLNACIRRPAETWLQSDLVTEEARGLAEESLREVATLMILLKDELNSTSTSFDESETVDSCLEQLRLDLKIIEELRGEVAGTVSMAIGNALFDIIVGKYDVVEGEDEVPLLLRLDEFEKSLYEPPPAPQAPVVEDSETPDPFMDTIEPEESTFAWEQGADTVKYVDTETTEVVSEKPEIVTNEVQTIDADIVDVMPEPGFRRSPVVGGNGDAEYVSVVESDSMEGSNTAGSSFVAAEVVSDDAFDTAVGEQKAVETVPEEDESEKEPNLAVTLVLRSLDVVFFVLEKLFFVVGPRSLELTSTAITRFGDVNRGGMGKKGWEKIKNSADAKGRY